MSLEDSIRRCLLRRSARAKSRFIPSFHFIIFIYLYFFDFLLYEAIQLFLDAREFFVFFFFLFPVLAPLVLSSLLADIPWCSFLIVSVGDAIHKAKSLDADLYLFKSSRFFLSLCLSFPSFSELFLNASPLLSVAAVMLFTKQAVQMLHVFIFFTYSSSMARLCDCNPSIEPNESKHHTEKARRAGVAMSVYSFTYSCDSDSNDEIPPACLAIGIFG